MKKLVFLMFLMAAAVSCASISEQNRDALQDQLNAENRLIKKNSELALRENQVLKTENAKYKADVNNLNDKVQRLRSDLESLNKRYYEDMTESKEAYESLEKSSDEKIRALTDSYAALEQKSSDEVAGLHGLLQEQQKSSQAERDIFGSKVKELETRLSAARQESGEKDQTIAALEKARQEDQARITALEQSATGQNEKIRQNETDYQAMALSLEQLRKEIEEKQALIDQLTARLNGLQGAMEKQVSE